MTKTQSGIVFIHKQEGITSFRTLDALKEKLGTRKIGHAGTLDKFASGVLIALAGSMTRLADYFSGMDKEYEAVFCFGRQTSTLDPEGETIQTGTVPDSTQITENVPFFTGSLSQIPPHYSAVHVAGKRASQIARSGETPQLKPRNIIVHDFTVRRWDPPYLHVRIRCSKGTYIRALARDFGARCGTCAYVTALTRTRIGSISLDDTHFTDEIILEKHLVTGKQLFSFLPEIGIRDVDTKVMTHVKYGRKLEVGMVSLPQRSPSIAALFYQDIFLALIEKTSRGIEYRFVSGEIPW